MVKPQKRKPRPKVTPFYDRLRDHIGHNLACVCYGIQGKPPENVAIECEDCGVVICDCDRYGEPMV